MPTSFWVTTWLVLTQRRQDAEAQRGRPSSLASWRRCAFALSWRQPAVCLLWTHGTFRTGNAMKWKLATGAVVTGAVLTALTLGYGRWRARHAPPRAEQSLHRRTPPLVTRTRPRDQPLAHHHPSPVVIPTQPRPPLRGKGRYQPLCSPSLTRRRWELALKKLHLWQEGGKRR